MEATYNKREVMDLIKGATVAELDVLYQLIVEERKAYSLVDLHEILKAISDRAKEVVTFDAQNFNDLLNSFFEIL